MCLTRFCGVVFERLCRGGRSCYYKSRKGAREQVIIAYRTMSSNMHPHAMKGMVFYSHLYSVIHP